MSGHADTIKRVTNDWIGYKPEAEHRERLLKAVFDAADAQEAENQRLREALRICEDARDWQTVRVTAAEALAGDGE